MTQAYKDRLKVCIRCENCLIFFMATPQHAKNGCKYCTRYCAGMAKRGRSRPSHVMEIMKKTWIKPGQRLSPKTEFKKGETSGCVFPKGHTPWNFTDTTVGCAWCGKEKHIEPSRLKNNRLFFCDTKNCMSKHYNKGGIGGVNKRRRDDIKSLHDRYVKIVLSNAGVDVGHITPDIIRLKRDQLTFHRLTKELKDGINRTRD